MSSMILKYSLLFCTCFLSTHGFWWNKVSTTTESPTVLRHIPLTYYRTYTYQPASPFNLPFFNAGGYGAPPQTPIIAGARFDNFYSPHSGPFSGVYSGEQMQHDAGVPFRTMKSASSSSSSTTTTTQVPTTTTTTSTTTTTPRPTTTTTTTSSSTTSKPTTESPYQSFEYPTYNRRFYMNNYGGNFYRPPYPYPEYSIYNPPPAPPTKSTTASQPQIQFVPCMCPVTIGDTASASYSQYFPLGRSNNGVVGQKSSDEEILALPDDNDKTRVEHINTAEKNVQEEKDTAVLVNIDNLNKEDSAKQPEAVQEGSEESDDVDD